MRVLVTRPEEDARETARLLAERGHEAVVAPLLATRFHDAPAPDLAPVQAILATSANGIRALARVTGRRDLTVFAVGPETAAMARHLGFAQVKNADGDARALADATSRWAKPEDGPLLHASGGSGGRLAADLAQRGFEVRETALYHVTAMAELPPALVTELKAGRIGAALFFSPRSARVFRELVEAACVSESLARVTAACISAAAAEALKPLRFEEVRIAAAPNQAALLASLEKKPDI